MMFHMSILSIQLPGAYRRGGGQFQEQHPGRGVGTPRV